MTGSGTEAGAVLRLGRWLLRAAYRVEVKGLEHYRAAGERVVVVANHTSFLDAALLAMFLPGRPIFAIDTHVSRRWWVRPLLPLAQTFPIDPTNALSTRAVIRVVQEGRRCIIFPEGRITVTGALMKIYEGPGMVADRADAQVLPVRIDGAQFTPFSRLKGVVRRRLFPRITITVLPPRRIQAPPELKGRRRRAVVATQLYDAMADMMYATTDCRRTLYQALLAAAAAYGGSAPVLEDIERRPLTYRRMVLATRVLGDSLSALTAPGERVGILLPNAVGTAATFFALQAIGRVPAILNFAAGTENMLAACRAAELRLILTSRRFIEAGRLEDAVRALSEAGLRIVHLDDLRARIGPLRKLWGLLTRPFAGRLHARRRIDPDSPAVVLFTSGTEGLPKGVVLSHRAILANCAQLGARVDFGPADRLFNALPVFHAFGLTAGMVLPLLWGIRTFLYPSPLHYRMVPEMIYQANATITFGTNTFLAGYARVANPYDFRSLRYVYAGAEKVREETRQTWIDRFGIRVLEGYGATETAPVIAANTPMHNRNGTVGRLLPGIRSRLEPVEGVERGGRLLVSGPNLMLGYLRAEHPGRVEPLADGWFDTGDVVEIDADGYVTIIDRAKRFAKVGGEMVSLGAVESWAASVWPNEHHAAVALPDPRRGEQLVLVTDRPGAERGPLLAFARKRGLPELMVPRQFVVVQRLPLLATGKPDYRAARALAEERLGSAG